MESNFFCCLIDDLASKNLLRVIRMLINHTRTYYEFILAAVQKNRCKYTTDKKWLNAEKKVQECAKQITNAAAAADDFNRSI